MRPRLLPLIPLLFVVGLVAGCGDTVVDEAATSTSTEGGDGGEDCVETVVAFLNDELDLTRLDDPTYQTEISTALGPCPLESLTAEQVQAVQGQLDEDVAVALGATPAPGAAEEDTTTTVAEATTTTAP